MNQRLIAQSGTLVVARAPHPLGRQSSVTRFQGTPTVSSFDSTPVPHAEVAATRMKYVPAPTAPDAVFVRPTPLL